MLTAERAQQMAAEATFIAEVVVGIIGQACGQGVDLHHAARTVLAVGAKGLRMAVGPDEAARYIREIADHVEADHGEARFDA
jgi:hypothetical protein